MSAWDANLAERALIATARRQAASKCTCGGELGYVTYKVPLGHALHGQLFRCKCRLEKPGEVDRILKNACVPDRYASSTLSYYDEIDTDLLADKLNAVNKADRVVQDLVDGLNPKSLVLWGPTGRGKTCLAAAMARELVGHGFPIAWSSWPHVVAVVQSSYGSQEFVPKVKSAEIAIIDELGDITRGGGPDGSFKATDDQIRIALDVIGYRHTNNLFTIITTNLNLDGKNANLHFQFGAPLAERIKEMSTCVLMSGKSLR